MMLNARFFERGQEDESSLPREPAARGARFVDPIDVVQFGAWVEQDGVQPGFAALLEETQRARQHGFTESELEREKVNLLSAIERIYKESVINESRLTLPRSTRTTSCAGFPRLASRPSGSCTRRLLPEISLD